MELPGWNALTLDGKSAPPLRNFQDKISLLLFFNIGHWECKEVALPLSRKLWDRFSELNIIGVHAQGGAIDYLPNQVRYVIEKKQIPYPVFQDQQRKTFSRFSVSRMPYWILRSKSGQIIKSVEGVNPVALEELTIVLEALFYGYSYR